MEPHLALMLCSHILNHEYRARYAHRLDPIEDVDSGWGLKCGHPQDDDCIKVTKIQFLKDREPGLWALLDTEPECLFERNLETNVWEPYRRSPITNEWELDDGD